MPVSVGDVIAVGNLIRDLFGALDDSRGSVTDYRDCQHELYALQKLLMQVEHLARDVRHEPSVRATYDSMLECVIVCRETIDTFGKAIEPYRRHFEEGSTTNTASRAIRKVQWFMNRKDDAIRFRTKITSHKGLLNL